MKQISKKNIKILITLGVLVLAVIGLTLAYYSSQKEFENEFRLKEPGVAIYEKFNPTDWWVPGEEKSKQAWFANSGEMDMLLRFSIEIKWADGHAPSYKDKDGAIVPVDVQAKDVVDLYWKDSKDKPNPIPLPTTLAEANALDGFDFIPITQDGVTYYYYKKVLKAKGTVGSDGADLSKTQNVLESVKFHTNLSNDGHDNSDYSNTQVDLTIKGETVLADAAAVKDQWKESPNVQASINLETGTVDWSLVPQETN